MTTTTPSSQHDEPLIVSLEQALARLPNKAEIHTFRNPASMVLIGADWDRDDLVEALSDADEIHETGNLAMSAHHGLAIMHDGRWLFIETTPPPTEPETRR